MENIAEGIVAGFAISTTMSVMYYFNKAALGTLFALNRAIGKTLMRVLLPPETETETRYVALKHTCNDDDCTIVCCFCGRDHYSCYNCESEKQELNP